MAVWDIFGPGIHTRASGWPLALAATLLLPLGAPAGLAAQRVHNVHLAAPPALAENGTAVVGGSRFRFEPWGGVLWDAYRNEGGDGRPAWIGAARVGYELTELPAGHGLRLIAEVAHAEAAEAGTATLQDSLTVGFRTSWWLTTAGVEWDVVGGWMGLTLDGRAGAAWIEREIVGGDSIPPGTPGTSARPEAEPFAAAVLGLSAWRHLSHTIQLRLRVEDVVTDPFDALEHSPVIGLGFRFVFE